MACIILYIYPRVMQREGELLSQKGPMHSTRYTLSASVTAFRPSAAQLSSSSYEAFNSCQTLGQTRDGFDHQGLPGLPNMAFCRRPAANGFPTFHAAPGISAWLPQARTERTPYQDMGRRSESSRLTRVGARFDKHLRKEGKAREHEDVFVLTPHLHAE
ncbi:hypothetical protein N431DRAFT_47098 [Stipitochalara longipes BDJ]|nr:hypothetical protein N431DRAFT_47098 [Stipitochalara longipes BDJ]